MHINKPLTKKTSFKMNSYVKLIICKIIEAHMSSKAWLKLIFCCMAH